MVSSGCSFLRLGGGARCSCSHQHPHQSRWWRGLLLLLPMCVAVGGTIVPSTGGEPAATPVKRSCLLLGGSRPSSPHTVSWAGWNCFAAASGPVCRTLRSRSHPETRRQEPVAREAPRNYPQPPQPARASQQTPPAGREPRCPWGSTVCPSPRLKPGKTLRFCWWLRCQGERDVHVPPGPGMVPSSFSSKWRCTSTISNRARQAQAPPLWSPPHCPPRKSL